MTVIHCVSDNTLSGSACGHTYAEIIWSIIKYREALVCHQPFKTREHRVREKVQGIEVKEVPGHLCRACARAINKRDRAFQRKTRRWFGSSVQHRKLQNTIGWDGADLILNPWRNVSRKLCVERAIAREEGRES